MAHRRLRSDFDGKIAGLYDLEETIGEGHFAVVKLARHVFTGEKVAVKVIDKTKLDEVSKAHLFQEVRCMKLVQHPNVVRLYEVIDTQTKLYLILELGDGGDMYEYIMKHEKGLEESNARTYFRQIVEAISYCHRLHVVHRDLKLENVVLFKKLGIVKLTDFGFSNMFNPGKHLETSCGSLAYSAPEILLGDSYDAPAVDIWSLGVILYMLVGGKPPFQEANDSETLTMIMDCNYTFPKHISEECKQLISIMLKRDPGHRANLGEIEEHRWLKIGSNDISHHHMPLISREHVSEEIHTCVVEKMVEGSIASKEEILQSVEKDSYDHITATYYLLAERKLRKQHQEILNAAAMSHLRKHSAPSTKPHLEPLALSPRKQREIKKTKTAPITQNITPLIIIPESPSVEDPEPRQDYFKSLTTSMTLDRRSSFKKQHEALKQAKESGMKASVSPRMGRLNISNKGGQSNIPVVQEPVVVKKKKHRGFSKIAILSSFFEKKAADLAASSISKDAKTGFWKFPSFGRKKSRKVKPRGLPDITALETPASGEDDQYGGVGSKEGQSKDDSNRVKPKGLMFSLLSPPGTHPSPSTSLGGSPTGAPGKGRKCSLIKEESVDEREEEEEEEEDMDFENYSDIRLAKSAENLDENYSKNASSPTKELDAEVSLLKRPLLSVASSPQLLNQICEENESEEEDDFVPPRINAPRMLTQRNSVASPEVIRKYEARKKRRGGSRGTSCSSSDASDTDDTEGRSRKDKLKHKFAHRRDSSDHSSDTDGGSNGHGGGGFGRGLGGGGSSGDGPSKDGDDRGGGGGKKGGGGGSPKNRHNGHHERGKHHNLSFKLGGELIPPRSMSGKSDKSVTSGLMNLSLASLSSKSSLKYVMERDEEVSDSDVEDNINEIEFMNKKNANNNNTSNLIEQSDFTKLPDRARLELTYPVIPTCTLDCDLEKGKRLNKTVIKMDINSNSCKTEEKQLTQVKMETKCCSVI